MYFGKKALLKILFVIMLCFSTVFLGGSLSCVAVEAAVKAPTLKDSEMTLYSGYESYTIKINNKTTNAAVTYTSSKASVASVSAKGVVKPVAAGKCTIAVTVKQNSKTYNLVLKVVIKSPGVEMTGSVPYLNVGESYLFKASPVGQKGKVTWSSSDSDIAKISAGGNVTAVSSGSVTIYAKIGKYTTDCEMSIGTNRIGTMSKNLTIYNKTTIYIGMSDILEDESVTYEIPDEKIISCRWEDGWDAENRSGLTITPISAGTETIVISSDKSPDRLYINVTVVDPPKDRAKLDAEALYSKCGPYTVEITATDSTYSSQGSGFFIGENMVVTNYHVIDGAEAIVVKTADSKELKVDNILGYDKNLDLAILEVDYDTDGLEISQDKVKVGQTIYTLGSPLGLTGTMTKGMVSTASRVMEDGVDYIQIDAAISPGNSGGPLVNEYGEVIGINTMYYIDGQNLNFAINIKELQKIITNHPITVKEYKELYDEMVQEQYLANMVHEDPEKSQAIDTCQFVDSAVGVEGTLKASETGDRYWFEVEEPGYFWMLVNYDTMLDMGNTYVYIYDSNVEYVDTADEYEDGTEYLKVYLNPGWYIIYVCFDEGYTGTDVKYSFKTYHY